MAIINGWMDPCKSFPFWFSSVLSIHSHASRRDQYGMIAIFLVGVTHAISASKAAVQSTTSEMGGVGGGGGTWNTKELGLEGRT
jgi:hypothetical protein